MSCCCVPQNTNNTNTIQHSVKHICQSKDISGNVFVKYTGLSPRVHLLKLFNVCLLILCILWTGFVNKNKGIKKRAYRFCSPICAWKVSHFFWLQNVLPNTWKLWGLSALQLIVRIRSLSYPFPFYLSSFLDSSTERLTHFKLRNTIKTCPLIASAMPVHKPVWAFHSLQSCITFQSNSVH